MYYGALMDKFNPVRLKSSPGRKHRFKYSWQQGAIHFLFYRDCYALEQMSIPQARGFTIARVWDEDPEVAELFSEAFYGKPQVCRSFQEVSDDVDLVFIAECNGDGSDHLKLATPGLSKGVPTFIDKPFAYDISQATRIVNLAQKKRTPVYSSSILRAMPMGAWFRNRFKEIQPVTFGSVIGCGGHFASNIHSLSLAQNLFGSGVTAVECMGDVELGHIILYYEGRRDRPSNGVVVHSLPGREWPRCTWSWKASLYGVAYGPNGCIRSEPANDYEFPQGALEILRKIKQMVVTGRPPMLYAEILELFAVATAARRAQKEGRRVSLREVWRRNGKSI